MMATEYDFLIVSGGTAGLVLACRLSEDPDVQILVLEAGNGRLENPRITTPGAWRSLFGDPDLDRNFRTTPQVLRFSSRAEKIDDSRLIAYYDLKELGGRCIGHRRGRVLSGTSAINALAVIAPSKASLDACKKLGNPGWNWKTMASYYRKFYTLTVPSESVVSHLGIDFIDDNIRGNSGPIKVSFPETQDPLSKVWIEMFKTLNYNTTGDPFSGQAIGGFRNPSSIHPVTKERSHAGSSYYGPVSHRPNLHVVTEAFVETIILDEKAEGFFASGLQFTHEGKPQEVTARKEIILAAGAFGSPHLLERSGIGDGTLLQSLGIGTRIDNPNVGENLQDPCSLVLASKFDPGGLWRIYE